MIKTLLAWASVASLAQPVTTPSSVLSEPKGNWAVDFADDYCLAGLRYATAYGDTVFQMRPDMMRRYATVYLIYSKTQDQGLSWGRIKLDWDGREGDDDRPAYYKVIELEGGKRALQLSVNTDDLPTTDRWHLRITSSKKPGFNLQIHNWKALQPLLDSCAVDLRSVKGVIESDSSKVVTRSKGNIIRYISEADYPANAMAKNEEGEVWLLYRVEANGRASNCVIEKSSGSKALDNAACAVLRRVRFQPAMDAQGNPVPENSSTRISWVLPDF